MHASCAAFHHRAVALPGSGGSGKSTLAAVLARRGWEFLADDLLPLHARDRKVLAYPSVPEVKLHPEAARAVGLSPGRLPRIAPGFQKRIWRLRGARGPMQLAAVYFPRLSSTARRVRLIPLSIPLAFRTMLRFNFNPQLQTRERMRRQLALFSHLAERVPARRLIIPRGWKHLHEAALRIEADLEEIRG